MLCLTESRLFWTMKPKSIDRPWLHVVARIEVSVPFGALRSFAARQMGHPSSSVGTLNWGIPFTNRCISERRRKLICPRRWCHSIRKAERLKDRTIYVSAEEWENSGKQRSSASKVAGHWAEEWENSGKPQSSTSKIAGRWASRSGESSNVASSAGGTWLG